MGKISGNSLLSSMAHSLSFSRSQSHAYTSSSDSHNLALIKFEAGLAERLCSLKAGSASANLNWLIDALAVANSTQSSLRSILPALTSHTKIKLQQSLDSTVGLLDVSSALKDAMDEIQDYLIRLQRAVKHVSEATNSQKNTSMQVAAMRLQTYLTRSGNGNRKRWECRLEEACRSLKLFKTQMRKSSVHSSSAVEGATLTTALVLAAITSRRRAAKISSHNVNAPWAGPLREVQRQLLSQQDGAICQELDSLHVAASALQQHSSNSSTDETRLSVTKAAAEAMLKKARDLEASVAELRQKLDVLFQSVASVRLDSLAN